MICNIILACPCGIGYMISYGVPPDPQDLVVHQIILITRPPASDYLVYWWISPPDDVTRSW